MGLVIVSLVVACLVIALVGSRASWQGRRCPACRSYNLARATRCAACTSWLTPPVTP